MTAFKIKTTWRIINIVSRDQVKIPLGLIKLHKELFITCNIFYLNNIPLFLTLSKNIYFTTVNHIANCTVPEIFKAFKEVYQYYLQHGFHVTKVHADGKFGTFKSVIESLPGVTEVNLAE